MKRLFLILLIIFSLPAMAQYDVFGQYNNPFSVWGSKTKKPSISFDTEAQALFTRMIIAGNAPSLGRQTLISNIFKMLKDSLSVSSLSTVFDCLYFLDNYAVASDTNIVKLNWIQDAYNLTSQGLLSYDSSGVNGNGSNSYFKTGFNPSVNGVAYTLNSASMAMFNKGLTAGGKYDMGVFDGTNVTGILRNLKRLVGINTTPWGTVEELDIATGFTGGTRTSSTGDTVFVNELRSWNPHASSALVNLQFYLMGLNLNNSFSSGSNIKYGLAMIGKGFTSIEVRKIFNIYLYWWANKNKAEYL